MYVIMKDLCIRLKVCKDIITQQKSYCFIRRYITSIHFCFSFLHCIIFWRKKGAINILNAINCIKNIQNYKLLNIQLKVIFNSLKNLKNHKCMTIFALNEHTHIHITTFFSSWEVFIIRHTGCPKSLEMVK